MLCQVRRIFCSVATRCLVRGSVPSDSGQAHDCMLQKEPFEKTMSRYVPGKAGGPVSSSKAFRLGMLGAGPSRYPSRAGGECRANFQTEDAVVTCSKFAQRYGTDQGGAIGRFRAPPRASLARTPAESDYGAPIDILSYEPARQRIPSSRRVPFVR